MKSYSFLPLPSPYITVIVLTLPPLPTDGTPHNCISHTRSLFCPRLALPENPLSQADLPLHVHDAHLRKEAGALQAGYAIAAQHKLLEYRAPPNAKSAHVTEFMTLTRAGIGAEGRLTFTLIYPLCLWAGT